ncbi:hypothetical protein ACFX12_009649 [Malus domestica]
MDRDGVISDMVFGVNGGDWLVELDGGCIVIVVDVGVGIIPVLVICDLDDVRRSCGVHRRHFNYIRCCSTVGRSSIRPERTLDSFFNTKSLWNEQTLAGKLGGFFVSTGTQGGGHKTTL